MSLTKTYAHSPENDNIAVVYGVLSSGNVLNILHDGQH